MLGTRGERRRRGLGRAALRAGLRGLSDSGADTAVLETGSTNRRSQPLYESEGFVTRTRIYFFRKTLPDGQPAT
jgi:ribosomal protein S18 acetylase RimI-like enzyme